MSEITKMLNGAEAEELLGLVYEELRQLARARMSREQPGHTLQPTALVHEAWIRLSNPNAKSGPWANRAHFFAAAAEAMRRILVDNARRKQQLKRGSNPERVDFEDANLAAPTDDEKLLQVHGALDTLAAEDPIKAEIVKLRYFVGLNHHEIAEAMGVNEKTIRRHWEVAKVRLYQLISAS